MWLRIQSNGVFKTLLLTLCITSLTRPSMAQCTGPLQSSVQTTSFTTGGNALQNFSFTMYNPPANYMLVTAVFNSTVTMSGTVTMLNNSGSDISSLRLTLSDEDNWQIGGNDILDNSGNDISDSTVTKKNVFTGPLNNGQSVTYGPATPFSNAMIFYDSITTGEGALSYFSGNGNVGITYINYPGYSISGGSATVTPNLTVSNNISLTYYYCYVGVLADDILSFTAVKSGNQVDLGWIADNETPGRTYTVQLSLGNGADFGDLVTIPALGTGTQAAYSNTYNIKPTDKGQLYFRLKMVDAGGGVSYSPMRIVDLNTGNTTADFSIYPNPPTNFIEVSLPENADSWQIDIVNAQGNLVQRNLFYNTALVQVNFERRLAAGTYFVRASNPLNGESHTGSFVIGQ